VREYGRADGDNDMVGTGAQPREKAVLPDEKDQTCYEVRCVSESIRTNGLVWFEIRCL
jgi:hypothetical protein